MQGGPISWTAHEDPVSFAGLGLLGEEVGTTVMLPEGISCWKVTITPKKNSIRKSSWSTWVKYTILFQGLKIYMYAVSFNIFQVRLTETMNIHVWCTLQIVSILCSLSKWASIKQLNYHPMYQGDDLSFMYALSSLISNTSSKFLNLDLYGKNWQCSSTFLNAVLFLL